MGETGEEKGSANNGKNSVNKDSVKIAGQAVLAIVIVVAIGLLASNYFLAENPEGEKGNGLVTFVQEQSDEEGTEIAPMEYAVRQEYFEEVFKLKRDEYNLFEKAAEHLNTSIDNIPKYFSLNSEDEIFGGLPKQADDFSEIAYLFANGRYFAIEYLDESYYKQPEFYPHFKEYGLRYWTEPDPKYWVPQGYGSYPAEQWTTMGKNDEFTAIVFFYSSWGVQTFQGVTLMPDSTSKEYFDIEISPQNFLLEPTFPKVYDNWAYKIVVKGKPKAETPTGTYTIGINVESPPEDIRSKWEFEHKNIYFDAVAGGIGPSGNQIQFNITIN